MSTLKHQTSNNSKFKIIRYTGELEPKIKELWNNLLIDKNLSYATSFEQVRKSLVHQYPPDDNCVLAIDENENILGMAQIVPYSQLQYRHIARIGLFYMAGFHGVGVGSPLIDSILEIAKEKEYLKVEIRVNAERKGARALYRKLGFDEEAYLTGSYIDPSGNLRNEIIMSKFITNVDDRLVKPSE